MVGILLITSLERLVGGYYAQAAQLVTGTGTGTGPDAALALYLAKSDPLMVLRDLLGHSSVLTTEVYLRQPSGIASDGRVCAGRLVSRVPQLPRVAGGQRGLTWPVAR